MKSLKKCAVALAMAVCSFGASADPVEISTAEQFATALSANPSGDYKLTADIALSNWESLEDFSGSIDGDGHTISGLTVPLFVDFSGVVTNLVIDGSVGGENTEITVPAWTNFALLSLTSTAARVVDTKIKGYSLVNKQSHNKDNPMPQNSIGFFVACANDGCVFEDDVVMDGCTVSLGGNVAFGGLVANLKRTDSFTDATAITFNRCINYASITSTSGCSGAGGGAIGGILGRDSLTGDSNRPATILMSGCVNNGSWYGKSATGNTVFGGMVGNYAPATSSPSRNTLRLVECVNHGGCSVSSDVSCNNMRLGGLIGMGGRYCDSITIEKCFNDGDIDIDKSSVSGNTHGGFIGYISDVSKNAQILIRNSVNRGKVAVKITSGKTDAVGGLVGVATLVQKYTGISFAVENCAVSGVLSATTANFVAGQLGTSTTVPTDMTVSIDNCWFTGEGDLIDTASLFVERYSATNIQYHQDGNDEAEKVALALIAEGEADYVSWTLNLTNGHPEPVLPAMKYGVAFTDYDGRLIKFQQVEEGQAAVAPPNPKRVGYSFKGWDPSDFSNVSSDMTIVATYEQSADYRTVTFVDYDERELEQVTVPSGTAVGDQAPTPTRTGYTLVGWTLDGEDYDLATPVTEDITLDAKYQINVYNVVFFDWEDNQLGETQKIEYLSAAVAPALPPIPEGKVFWKWSDDFSSVTEDMEVYARICDREQHITSAEDFAELINAQSPSVATFYLDADIVLSDWTSVNFFASLNGQGHVIGGLTKPLFNTLKGATVENLVFTNCVLTAKTESVFGLVACTAGDATVIRRVTTDSDCAINAGIANLVAGGIVGQIQNGIEYEGDNCSWIIDCTNRAAIVKTTTDSNSRGAIGGIVGSIEAKGVKNKPAVTNGISGCVNVGNITCNFNGGNIAGLVGRVCSFNEYGLVALIGSANLADIGGVTPYGSDQYKSLIAAGFVGRVGTSSDTSYDILIDGCVNRGRISVGFEPDGQTSYLNKTASGMVSVIDVLTKSRALTIRNSANYGDVEGENAAGIIARFNAGANYAYTKGLIENCASYGSVAGRTAAALAVAKWSIPSVAYTRTVTNCFFVADAERSLPLVGGDTAGFVTDGCFLDSDPGYNASSVRAQLNAVARDKEWGLWRTASFNDIAYPQLKTFSRANGLMLFVK